MLDSLVRVSRRVDEKHFARVSPSHDRASGQKLYPSLFPHEEESLTYTLWRPQRIPLLPIGSFSAISGTISLSFQSSFHLSLTVLVRYRSPTHI